MAVLKKIYLILILFISFFVVSCDKNEETIGDVSSVETEETITVENTKIRFVFSKSNGSLREIYNK